MDNRKLRTTLNFYSLGALRISGIYLLIGVLWILFSDKLATRIALDQSMLTTISIYKGWAFIVITAILLYWLIERHVGELRESEEKLRLVTDAMPALISYVDSDKHYQFNNQAYEEWFGHEVAGKRLDEVLGSTAYHAISKYVDAALRGETVNYQTEITFQDGDARFVDATYVPDKTKDGTVRGFYALVQDITERKQAYEEVRLWADAFEHCAQGIAIADPDTNRIVVCNSGFALLHKKRIEEVVGSSVLSLYAPSDHDNVRQNVIRADQIGHAQFEAYMIRRDGSTFPVQMDFVSVRGDDGDILYRVATAQDISEGKKAEQEIADQANILEHVTDAVIVTDENFLIKSWNSAAERMYGWKAEEVIGRQAEAVLQTEFSGITREETIGLLRDTGEFSEEFTQTRKDGTKFQVDARTVAVHGDDGRISKVVSVNRDITERKQAENALRESRELFVGVFQSSPTPIALTHLPDGKLTDVNEAFCELFGYSREEVIGHTSLELGIADPESRQKAVERLKEKGVIRNLEQKARTRNGKQINVLNSIETINVGGDTYALTTLIDITSAKQAEGALQKAHNELELKVQERTASLSQTNSLLQALMDYMPDHIYFKDTQGRFIRNSKSQAEMLGLSSPDQVVGKTDFDFFPHAAKAFADEQQVIKTGRPMVDFEEQVIWPDKSETWVSTTKVPLRNSEGQTIGIFGISRDITERKQGEQAIRQLNINLTKQAAQLHIANKELEAFSYSVSHDLRAPLRAINGYTQILVDEYTSVLDEEGKRICNIIRAEARRMGNLIDDLLSFSRLSRKEIQSARVDMKALAYSVFGELTTEAARERIDFKMGKLPVAEADPALLHQVWVNLISNAIKFTSKKDRAVIEVGTKRSEAENIYCVRDNGAGFDIQYVDKMFSVFQRLHSEDDFEGTGVGLAIVQRIIQRHGGRVWAEGEVGKGATFYFALPRRGESHE